MKRFSMVFVLFILLFGSMNSVYAGRYFIPELARWATPDPLMDNYPSLSPYNYVANNSIS